jgi:glutathione S-transferase
MPDIKLYELGPTRSARCRWTLLEADLDYESVGNDPSIIGSDELKRIHPLGKLPAAVIDGRPLFESAAISAAIADLVPEKHLIAEPGTWSRALHDQWVIFALTEMEAWVWSAELNSMDFVLPKEQHVPAIIGQNEMMFTVGTSCRRLRRK